MFGERDRGRNSGRIFVNVKRAVEMRDAQAFQIEFGIEHELGAEISLEQRAIFALENVERQRFAAFLDRMDDLLKLGEHRLPEDRAANVIDLPVDDVGAHLRVGRLLEQDDGSAVLR